MICRRPTFVIALALATALFLAARVRAAIEIYDSLELRVADASVVMRGTLETFEPSRNSYEATGRFHVIETLKGKTESSIECMIPHGAMRYLEAWQKGKVELLLCLVKSERYRTIPNQVMPAEWSVLQGHSDPDGIIPLNGDPDHDHSGDVPTTDFQFLSKPDDILKLARAAIRADAVTKVLRGPGGGVTSVVVSVPSDSPMGKIIPQKAVPELETVVNEPLETKARQWIKTDAWIQKLDGVRVLSHFKSEENIAALKPLLTDPNAQRRREGGEDITTYPVRAAVLDVLKSWGVDTTAVVSEKAPAREP